MTAVLFQSMPPLSPDEYAALEASIREHGVQVPILRDENGVVIDGHHRQKIAAELGVECPERIAAGMTDAQKRTLSFTLNIDRRHLTREQKRDLVAASLEADPELSDRQHADRTGVSPSTAGSVRAGLVAEGRLSKLDSRVSADGRQRPATQPAKPQTVTRTETETHKVTEVIDATTGEVLGTEQKLAAYLDADPELTRLKGEQRFRTQVHAAVVAVMAWDATEVAELIDADTLNQLGHLSQTLARFVERIRAARPQSLRLITGEAK